MSEEIVQQNNGGGLRPGAIDPATMLAGALAGHEGHRIARIVVDKALAGDASAARFVIGRLTPRPRGRVISLALPEGARAGDTVAAFNATLQALAAGEITPDEALTVTRVFDARLKALKAWELERFLTRWDPIPGDALFEAYEEEEDEEDEEGYEDVEDEEGDGDGAADAPAEASAAGSGPSAKVGEEGASPANGLHPGDNARPDPSGRLSEAPADEPGSSPGSAEIRADAPEEPDPSGPFAEGSGGQGADASPANDLHPGGSPHPEHAQHLSAGPEPVPPSPLHSACFQPSPATVEGRRRVAELTRQQWIRELTR